MDNLDSDYQYDSAEASCTSDYLWQPLLTSLNERNLTDKRIFEIGCGNGSTANMLSKNGFQVTAIDPSKTGIEQAKSAFPQIKFAEASAYDDLAKTYGTFPSIVSLEVVEHVFWPRKYAQTVYDCLEPNGIAYISTPYHGYLKNLAIALTGKFDGHFTALWDGGHIKFWSEKTLTILLEEAGFKSVEFIRAGRIPPLAKSMIAIARK